MTEFSFIFTIFFMLLGPIKIIGAFANLTREKEEKDKRSIAAWSALIAALLCGFVALSAESLLRKFHISIDAIKLAGGLILLIASLIMTFQQTKPEAQGIGHLNNIQIAVKRVVAPMIVPPAGIAAIMVFMLISPQYPGMDMAVAICLSVVMALNFLVMFFNSAILKIPGLLMVLTILSSVLVFIQVCLSIQILLGALTNLRS